MQQKLFALVTFLCFALCTHAAIEIDTSHQYNPERDSLEKDSIEQAHRGDRAANRDAVRAEREAKKNEKQDKKVQFQMEMDERQFRNQMLMLAAIPAALVFLIIMFARRKKKRSRQQNNSNFEK
jgi:hypothetical protein